MTSKRVDELLKLLKVSHKQEELIKDPYDCLPVICTEIFSNKELMMSKIGALEELLRLLPEVCSVKELLITLLLQMDTFKEDCVFSILLPPIGNCIRLLPTKRHLSLANALETAGAHIDTIIIQDEPAGCVELLPAGDPVVERRLISTVSTLLDFVRPFVEEVSSSNGVITVRSAFERQRSDLARCLLKILGGELAHVKHGHEDSIPSDEESAVINECGLCAERCVRLLLTLHPDVVKLIHVSVEENLNQRRRHHDDLDGQQRGGGELLPAASGDEVEELSGVSELVSDAGLAMLAYFVFGDPMVGVDVVPRVYSHQFLVEFNLRHIIHLLNENRSVTVMKGIMLGLSLLRRIEASALDPRLFELSEMTDMITAVVRAMTGARVKKVCQQAVLLLSALLKAFHSDGRCRLLEFLLCRTSSASVRGYAIVLVKNEIDGILREQNCSSSEDNVRALLQRLQHLIFFVPPDGFRAKLLTDERESIMSALNLLRYLLIRDTPGINFTGIWNSINVISDSFLRPLRDGMALALGDVQAELRNLQSERGHLTNEPHHESPTVAFCVDSEEFGDLSVEQRVKMMNVALVNLSMFESVLSRVEELARCRSA